MLISQLSRKAIGAAIVFGAAIVLAAGFGCSRQDVPIQRGQSDGRIADAMSKAKPMTPQPPSVAQLTREKNEIQNNASLPPETKKTLLSRIDEQLRSAGGH